MNKILHYKHQRKKTICPFEAKLGDMKRLADNLRHFAHCRLTNECTKSAITKHAIKKKKKVKFMIQQAKTLNIT